MPTKEAKGPKRGLKHPLIFNTTMLSIGLALFSLSGSVQQSHRPNPKPKPADIFSGNYVVLGYNDLGMHCMNQDFSELCVLPPANTLRATVIRRGLEPQVITSGVSVTYSIPGNTDSTRKTNFWQYALPLFGANLPANMGLFGWGLAGTMSATTDRDYIAQGIPLTQMTDAGVSDAYQLSQIEVRQNGTLIAATEAVVPVSWEMNCIKCHNPNGTQAQGFVVKPPKPPQVRTVAQVILEAHDRLSGTHLMQQRPVLCASCHADPVLGAAGKPGIPSLSSAMHTFHADKFAGQTALDTCYSCHPGAQTQCLRDVHKANGLDCNSCHVSMAAVGNPARTPWVDEPRCGSCHNVPGHEYEQPGVLFRNSVGHNGVKCIACHGSPHAITPSLNERDNRQSVALQGAAGPIGKFSCLVCHTQKPSDPFNHTRNSD